MFSGAKLVSDFAGTADNCSCISREQIQAESSVRYLLHGETPQIFLKSLKEDHIFTDQAYISVIGKSAAGTKRLVTRYDFHIYPISNVAFETYGVGVTDQDCELKFQLAGQCFSIDLKKHDQDTGILYYRALCAVANAQARDGKCLNLLQENRKRLDIHLSDAASIAASLTAVETAAVHEATSVLDRFNPVSYAAVFQLYIK
jgi:hypothetical protein